MNNVTGTVGPQDETCPQCAQNLKAWSDDVVERINEWDALMTVAVLLTGKSQAELQKLAMEELERKYPKGEQ